MSTTSEINDYFSQSTSNDITNLGGYYGNPDYTKLSDTAYTDITLDDLGFSVDNVKFELKGIVDDLTNPETGEAYTDADYQNVINRSVAYAEKEFDIVIRPRKMMDRVDYWRNDFNAYMYVRTEARPILHVENVKIYFDNYSVMDYQDNWVKVTNRMGQVQIQPSLFMQGYANAYQLPFSMPDRLYGIPPIVQNEYAPQMVGLTYIAGMMPSTEGDGINRSIYPLPDLQAYVAKYAAIEILERWGRNIIDPGIASYSVSIDGITSSENTTASAENSASAGEINNLTDDMKHIRQGLESYYARNIGIIG